MFGSIKEKLSYVTQVIFLWLFTNQKSECTNMVSLQGIFEGLKAYRTEDGRILLFRPEENALRMKVGADRLCMPSPSVEQFVDAVKQTVIANKRWVCISSYLSLWTFLSISFIYGFKLRL
jgi:branched-subunit amino acid aminotransferase/4-amino-4-deoxychorismate lyase